MIWLPTLSLLLLAAPEQMVCDFDTVTVPWRSKFARHEVVELTRDGVPTRALHFAADLSQPPHYDWLRAMTAGIDVREYRYLNLRVRGDARGAVLQPILMRAVPPTEANTHGEITAAARDHPLLPADDQWHDWSLPLAAFGKLEAIAERVDMINFSFSQSGGANGPIELWFDDLSLSVEPRGTLVDEAVPYPPADIAVGSEAAFFALLDLTRPDLAAVRAAVERRDWPAAKAAWARHLETREAPRWVWSRRDRDRLVALERERFGGGGSQLREADRVLARDFDILGVRKQLDRDVEWLQGPLEWTHVLSRFHYWKSMGLAWWLTGDDKYAEDFVYLLRDWVEDNPVPRIATNSRGEHGTVWRTLETGIRGDDWFDAMEFFMDAPAFDAEAKYEMTRSLVEQARHLHRYTVEFRFGNWQVVECTGLAAIGIMLPEFREAAAWRERAFDYLVRHMERDVYPDGAHHELTPGYHSWVMERFLKVARLAQVNGYEVPGLLERHEKMFEFLQAVAFPDRRYPSLGDAGRGGSIAGWMGLGALLYDRPDMRYLAVDEVAESWLWWFGPEVIEQYARLESSPPERTFTALPDAQYLQMRTGWTPTDRSVLFDCAPWGGGHSHQDRLQVLLYAGRPLLLDPGIYSYDQPLSRTWFRTAPAHNVLLIDGDEQPQAEPEVVATAATPGYDLAVGSLTAEHLRHQRTVLFVKPDYLVIVDHIFGQGITPLTRLFHLPRVEVEVGDGAATTAFADGVNVRLAALDPAGLELRQGWLPKGNAEAVEAPVVAFTATEALPHLLITVATLAEAGAPFPAVARLANDDGLVAALQVTLPDGRVDRLFVAPDVREIRLGEQDITARAVLDLGGARQTVDQ